MPDQTLPSRTSSSWRRTLGFDVTWTVFMAIGAGSWGSIGSMRTKSIRSMRLPSGEASIRVCSAASASWIACSS